MYIIFHILRPYNEFSCLINTHIHVNFTHHYSILNEEHQPKKKEKIEHVQHINLSWHLMMGEIMYINVK